MDPSYEMLQLHWKAVGCFVLPTFRSFPHSKQDTGQRVYFLADGEDGEPEEIGNNPDSASLPTRPGDYVLMEEHLASFIDGLMTDGPEHKTELYDPRLSLLREIRREQLGNPRGTLDWIRENMLSM